MERHLSRLACLVALAAFAHAGLASAAVSRGIGGETIGAQIDPERVASQCSNLRADGAHATALFLNRGFLEKRDGTLNTTVIDNRVEADRGCGLEVGVRVSTRSADQEAALPADLAHYTDLLRQLSAYLGDRVERYAIENEVTAPSHWPGTADEYFTLLRAASDAIHAGNPDARVLDGVMSSGALTTVQVNRLYATGRRDEALALVQEMQANELGGGRPVRNQDDLDAFIASDQVQRILTFFRADVANQGSYDAFQAHYYGPWDSLPSLLRTTRELGIAKPIELWELNHRYLDYAVRPYDETEHADEAARLLVTAAGEGSGWTVFTSYLGKLENRDYGLLSFDGTSSRPARFTFRTVSRQLTGATRSLSLRLPDGATGYRFERPQGEVTVAWADPGPARVGASLGLDATTAAVQVAGSADERDVRLGRLKLEGTPRFVRPDLVELSRLGKSSRKRVRLRLECPSGSPFRHCAGRIKVTRRLSRHGSDGRRRDARGHGNVLGRASYRVRRGEHERLRVRLSRRGKPREATAVAKRSPAGGRRHAESWTRLR